MDRTVNAYRGLYLVVQSWSAKMGAVTSANEAPDNDAVRLALAEAVRTRRLQLGISVRAAAEQAGIARGTWIALEDASRRTAETAYAGIERTLQWKPGSLVRLLKTLRRDAEAADTPRIPSFTLETLALSIAEEHTEREDPVVRIMRDDRLTDQQKARIIRTVIAEQEQFARERAVELIRDATQADRQDQP